MPDAPPQRIGKYEIQAELGRGGFGRVYRGFDPKVGRLVAIKILNADGGRDLITRFKNEAAAAGKLQHRNIVTVYEFGEDRGLPFIAMEHLEGEDLQQVLSSGRKLSLLEKVEIMSQVAEGLDCAHRNGIVHRDVKPANIRLLPDATVKIMDFGIARLLHDSIGTRLTRQGHVIGTLLYMSPEQVLGADTDALCDIFAFGVTYYELLTGINPFSAADPRAVFYKITSEDPSPVRSYVPDCPEALDQAVRKALEKERDLRYQSLRDLLFDTEPVQIELRQEKAARLLAEARAAVESDDLDAARGRLAEALELDPGNRGARQLRESVQARIRRRALRPRIDTLLAKADESESAGRFNEAADSLELARQLDPADESIQSRLQEIRSRIERVKRASQLLSEARSEAARQNLHAALQKAGEALEADPGSAEAAALVEKLRKEAEDREQRRKLDQKLRDARDFLLAGAFDDAAAVLDSLDHAQRRSEDVKDLQARIKAHRFEAERQDRLRSELAAAREMVDRLRFSEAVAVLRRLREEFPGEERVSGLLTYAEQELLATERARAVEALRQELLGMVESHDFETALARLEEGLARFRDQPALLRLRHTVLAARQRWIRQQAIDAAVARARELAGTRAYREAVQMLDAAAAEHPDAPELAEARQRIANERDEYEKAEAARQALERARAHLSGGDPAAAARVLESALATGDAGIAAALDEARQAVRDKARREAIDRAVREARAASEAWQFARALQIVDRALESYPGEEALESLRAATIEAQARWERDEAVAEAIRTAGALRAQVRFGDAIAQLESCLARFPGDERLTALYGHIQSDWERQVRAEAVARAGEEALELIEKEQPDDAAAVLRRALDRYPGEKALLASLARAETAARDKRRAEAVRRAVSQVDEALQVHDFGRAHGAVEACRTEWPEAPELAAQFERVSSARAAYERDTAVSGAVASALAQAQRGEFGEALELLQATLRKYPGERRLQDARASVEARWEERKRADAIRRVIGEAAEARAGGDLRAAVDLLRRAAARHGNDPDLASALQSAEAGLEAEERAEAVETALAEAEALSSREKFDSALEVLNAALRYYPGEPELLEKQRMVAAAQQRGRAIASAIQDADESIRSGNYAAAVAALEQADRQYSGSEAVRAALASARDALRREEHRRAVASLVSEAEGALRGNDPARAVALLQNASPELGAEPVVQSALQSARKAAAALERQRGIQAAAAEIRGHASAGRFGQALACSEAALRTYAGEPELASLKQQVEAAKAEAERQERDRAIRAVLEMARERVAAREFDAAIQGLEAVLRTYPDANALKVTRERAISAKASHEREQAVAAAVRRCEDLITSGQIGQAAKELQAAAAAFPGEPSLKALQARLEQHWERQRRIDSVRRAVANAEQLLSQEQPARAISLLQAAAAQYPGDPELQGALAKASAALREQHRSDAIESTCKQTRVFLDRQEFDRALETVERGIERSGGAEQLTRLQETILQARTEWERARPVQRAQPQALRKQAGAVHSTDSAVTDEIKVPSLNETVLLPGPVPTGGNQPPRIPDPGGPPVQSAAPPPQPTPHLRIVSLPGPEPARRTGVLPYALVAVGVLGVAAVAWFALNRPRTAGPAVVKNGTAIVEVTSDPSGASVKVGGKTCVTPECSIETAAGTVRVQASLPGYAEATREVTVESGKPAPVHFQLQPLPVRLHIGTNFPAADLALNGRSAGSLQDGQIVRDLPPGPVEVRVSRAGSEARLLVRAVPGRMPGVDVASASRELEVVTVTSLGSEATLTCLGCSGAATLDGREAGSFAAGRLTISDLSNGPHELRAGGRTIAFNVAGNPSVTVQLISAASNAGTLVVGSNEDGATVLIDRKKYTLPGRELRLALEPGSYRVSAEKQGFRAVPGGVTVRLSRGGQAKASFRFEAEAVNAALVNFPPGASITVDGKSAGSVGADGRLAVQLQPGAHNIAVRADGYQPLAFERTVTAQQAVVDGAVVGLQAVRKQPEPPPKTDPAQQERQAWSAVQNTRDPDQLEAFLRSYQSGPHAAEARAKMEQLLWDRVDKNDRRSVEDFRQKFPNSQAARDELARLDRAAAEAQQRQRESDARAEADRKLAGDRQAVRNLLRSYAEAYEQKDYRTLVALRPELAGAVQELKRTLDRYRSVKANFALQGEPEIRGDTAVVHAILQVETVDAQQRRQQPIAYAVTCVRRAGGWVIDSMK